MRTLVLTLGLAVALGTLAPLAAEDQSTARLRVTRAMLSAVPLEPAPPAPPVEQAARQPAGRRGWLQRNWKWLVPAVAGAAATAAVVARRDGTKTTTPSAPPSGG